MANTRIEGNGNIANTGIILGNCISNSTIINLEFSLFEFYKKIVMDQKEIETSLSNLTEATKKLANAIDKFAQARENDSLANINYSKVLLEDREIIKKINE